MDFDAIKKPYAKSRYSVSALNGIVATSSALASSAGLEMLKKGGNAIDAALASAAVLTVVEPVSNGVGGDAFAIVYNQKDKKLYGLNSSGYSGEKMTIEAMRERGFDKMPRHGWLSITVPGVPKAWSELSERFGKLPLREVLKPAIEYADKGFCLSPVVGHLFEKYVDRHAKEFKGHSQFNEWFKVFTKKGEPYHFGEVVYNHDLAKTLRLLSETNCRAFYEGEIAQAIVSQSDRDGGLFTLDDLRSYKATWVDPIGVNYKGIDVYELPPNGQGIVTLIALNILKNLDLTSVPSNNNYHYQMEAIKLAFEVALKNVTDPNDMKVPYSDFLKDEFGKELALKIKDIAYDPFNVDVPRSGTVYLATADSEGNMVSYIQSNYQDFGSGIVIEDYGISMQNRAGDFSLDPHAANALKPRKRTYHTIIPGFMMKGEIPIGPFGVMGGYMQPQGHLQVLNNLIDYHLNPQMCLDAPRWQWKEGKSFIVEPDFPKEAFEELKKRGHDISYAEDDFSFGRGQMIVRLENGIYVAATESRTDGAALCY